MRAHMDTRHKETDNLDTNDPAGGEGDAPHRELLEQIFTESTAVTLKQKHKNDRWAN